MFCSNCGQNLEIGSKFCSECGARSRSDDAAQEFQGTRLSEPSSKPTEMGNQPKTSSKWLVLTTLGGFAAFAIIAFSIAVSSPPLSTDDAASQETVAPAPLSPTFGPEETVGACNELKPLVERTIPNIGTRVSDAKSDEALGILLLGVNSVSRNFKVDGIYPETTVPMRLSDFAQVIEGTMVFTFEGDSSPITWTKFVDALRGSVIEPCTEVGVNIVLTSE